MKAIAVGITTLLLGSLVPLAANAQGALENPRSGGVESGIAAITGWHCTSRDIEIRIDGVSIGKAGTGTPRLDTQAACGRSDTGYSLLFNYALLHGGTHRVDAYADGQPFGSSTFFAGYSGSEFLTGASASHDVPDFPSPGQKSRIVWSEAKQNFVLAEVTPVASGTIPGSYSVRQLSGISTANAPFSSLQAGVSVSGTITFDPGGTYWGMLTITANGTGQAQITSGTWSDQGSQLVIDGVPSPIIERGETLSFQMLGSNGSLWIASAISLARGASAGASVSGGVPLRNLLAQILAPAAPPPPPPPPPTGGCPAPATGTVMATLPASPGAHATNDGSANGYWLEASGVITAMPLPTLPSGYASGSVQMTYGARTPAGTGMYEISISKCPGVIDTTGTATPGGSAYCYFGSSNPTNLTVPWFARGSSIYGPIGTLAARGYCVADETQGPWYMNFRYTYSDCPYGPGNCGEQLQWNLGSQ